MVISSEFRIGQYKDHDYREDASHFSFIHFEVIFLENVHYKSTNGSIECGYNVIEINILMHDTTEDPVGFGIQVENEIGEIIQTCVILQPFQYQT